MTRHQSPDRHFRPTVCPADRVWAPCGSTPRRRALAFALQQVITSIAGYFVILRGNTFIVGDRITMGGVRGDVMRLGFIQTTIMEMGQPPSVQGASPAMWVHSRQFTGRIVTVSNAKIFADMVFNYTRDFPSSGRRWRSRSPASPTAAAPRRSCWRRPARTPPRPPGSRPRRRRSSRNASVSIRSSSSRASATG